MNKNNNDLYYNYNNLSIMAKMVKLLLNPNPS
jgi:hypothetical protein